MTKSTPMIPAEAIEPDFIAALRDRYVAREPTAQRLSIAASIATDLVNELGRSYLDGALSMSREAMREILLGKINYRPEPDDFPFDEDEPAQDHRAPAAILFLYGVSAGYWTATAEETELARALIIAAHGMEVLDMLKPQRTKDDLAREAGVPNKSFIHKTPQDGRTSKQIVDDYLYVTNLSAEADRIAATRPRDIDAIGVALKAYLDALKRYFPASYEMQIAHLRRILAPATAKFYVELVKRHDHQKRTA